MLVKPDCPAAALHRAYYGRIGRIRHCRHPTFRRRPEPASATIRQGRNVKKISKRPVLEANLALRPACWSPLTG
ncbi:hypothetical protein KCP73_07665 [Salmonella enterica subsp. enterica]|nr:hypothetical protein KCP73_07665 [Salmonella enterica subsp. enterica]